MTSSVQAVSPLVGDGPRTAGTRATGRVPAVVTGAGQAFPPGRSQQEYWDRFYGPHCGGSRWARAVFMGAGCSRRHTAVDPTVEDISQWSTGARMGRYLDEALPLAAAAAIDALSSADVEVTDLGLLAVVSCTGYTTPGLDIRLAERLGADPSLQRLLIGHMGCYAALPGLGAVSDNVVARGRPALLVCVEVASLHVQPSDLSGPDRGGPDRVGPHRGGPGSTTGPGSPAGGGGGDGRGGGVGRAAGGGAMEQVVAHALFSDAAAAVVVEPGRAPGPPSDGKVGGLEVIDVVARTDVDTADHMRWDITDLGFRMGLSRRVPDVMARHVEPMVDELLARNAVGRDAVDGWAVHPGGPRILDVVADRLRLDDAALAPSRDVLDRHGNCSSATLLVVLDHLRSTVQLTPGRHVVGLAFGPGLTLYGVLLRVHPGP